MNMISFTANFVKNTTITRNNIDNKSEKIKASFVELDPQCENDVSAMRKLNSLWEQGRTYAEEIYENMDEDYFRTTPKHYYALTLQRHNFDKLDHMDILGIAEICNKQDNSVHLNYLQVDPTNNYGAFEPTYRGVGSAILKCIKEEFPKSNITLSPRGSVVEFYEKNGFKECSNGIMEYYC